MSDDKNELQQQNLEAVWRWLLRDSNHVPSKDETLDALAHMYGFKFASDDERRRFAAEFEHWSPEALRDVVVRIVRVAEWMPTPPDIISAAMRPVTDSDSEPRH